MTLVRRQIAQAERPLLLKARGHRQGPIIRLTSPSDVGEIPKPLSFSICSKPARVQRPESVWLGISSVLLPRRRRQITG
jgi:hypothetical protein